MKTFKAKSVVISRKPDEENPESWSAFIGLFTENNPHLKARVPFEVLEYPKIEKVRLHDLRNISFYLEGSDVVINNMVEVTVEVKKGIVTISGKQNLPNIPKK